MSGDVAEAEDDDSNDEADEKHLREAQSCKFTDVAKGNSRWPRRAFTRALLGPITACARTDSPKRKNPGIQEPKELIARRKENPEYQKQATFVLYDP